MTKHKSKTNAVLEELRKKKIAALDKLRRKRSAAIKAVAKANAALDAQLEYRDSPGFVVQFEELAAIALKRQEYELAIELNNLCYIDQDVADDYGSVQIIKRTEAEWAARENAAERKAAGLQPIRKVARSRSRAP
jgi:hypothetical protein